MELTPTCLDMLKIRLSYEDLWVGSSLSFKVFNFTFGFDCIYTLLKEHVNNVDFFTIMGTLHVYYEQPATHMNADRGLCVLSNFLALHDIIRLHGCVAFYI